MKTKTLLLVCSLLCFVYSAFGKGEFKMEPQNITADSTNPTFSYFHISAGSIIIIDGVMHYSDSWGFYIGPADSVHWFFDGNAAGVTYGAQTISLSQPGIYSAIGYYAGISWPSQKEIVLMVLNPTGIAENSTPGFSIIESKPGHSLVITNLLSGKTFSATLYTITGMLVARSEMDVNAKVCSLSLNGIRKGIYLVDIISDEKRFSKKIFLDE